MATLQKSKFVRLALRRAGIASDDTLRQPDQSMTRDALDDLESMMASIIEDGVALPYKFTTNQENIPDGNEDSGLELWTLEAIALKLAQRILIDNQRDLTPQQNAVLREQWDVVKTAYYKVPSLKQRNDMLTGQGNNPYWAADRFYYDGTDK